MIDEEQSQTTGWLLSKPMHAPTQNLQDFRRLFESNTSEATDSVEFWRTNADSVHPKLLTLAVSLLATPASSVPSERHNSGVALVLTPKRRSMKPESVASWLMIRDFVLNENYSAAELVDEGWSSHFREHQVIDRKEFFAFFSLIFSDRARSSEN